MSQDPIPPRSQHRFSTVNLLATAGVVTLAVSLVMAMRSGDAPDPHSDASAESAKKTPVIPPMKPAILLSNARRKLREGNLTEAYRNFQKFGTTRSFGALADGLQLELAICAEGVGDVAAASRLYESLSISDQPAVSAAALLGLARLKFREGRFESVDNVLTPGLLSGLFSSNQLQSAEASYLLAVALARIAQPATPLLAKSGLAYVDPVWSLKDVIPKPTPTRQEEVLDFALTASGSGTDAVISGKLESQSLTSVVARIAMVCGTSLDWSEMSTRQAKGRALGVTIQNAPASVVLDQLLSSSGLSWHAESAGISIRALSELGDLKLRKWKRERATRALWNAITAFPEHRHANVAMLSLGNVAALTEPEEAAARYDECLRRARSRLRSAILFNRGKTALALNNPKAAMEHFLSASEHGRGTLVNAVSLLYVGSLRMEAGAPQDAVNPLLRAIGYLTVGERNARRTLSSDRDREDALAAAVHSLAIAWLASGNPFAARRALRRHWPTLRRDAYRNATAFLAAAASYRMSESDEGRLREGPALVAALTRVTPDSLFPQAGLLLIGESWKELGISAQMAALYSSRLPQLRTDWMRRRMAYSLIEYHRVVGNEKQIEQLLALVGGLAEGDDGVGLAQAEQYLRAGQFNTAVVLCRGLLSEPGTNRSELLRVMGRAFEKEQNFRDAALCFAGMLPPDGAPEKD